MNNTQHKSTLYLFLQVQNACLGAFTAGYTMSELGISFDNLAIIYGIPSYRQNELCVNIFIYYIYHFQKYPSELNQMIVNSYGHQVMIIWVYGSWILGLTFLILKDISCGHFVSRSIIIQYVSQFLTNKMERRKFMMLADVVFLFASGLTQLSEWWVFMLARFMMGLAVGMNASIISIYIREISPDNMTGKTGALFQANLNLGIIFGFIMNLPLKENVDMATVGQIWRLVFLFAPLFSLLRLILLAIVFTLDTPYYYFRNGLHNQGRQALENIFKPNFILELEGQLVQPGSIDFSDLNEEQHLNAHNNQEISYKNRLLAGMGINFLQQMCGNTFMAVFSTSVLGTCDSDFANVRSFVMGSYIFLFFVSTLGVSFNRKLARKRYLICGFMFCSILQLFLSILSFQNQMKQDVTNKFLFILFLFAFYATYNFSVGPVTSIYTSDILKDKGMSYSIVMNWLGNVISLTLFLNTHMYLNHFIFATFSAIGVFFTYKFVVETRSMNFSDILKSYNYNKDIPRSITQQMTTLDTTNKINDKLIII